MRFATLLAIAAACTLSGAANAALLTGTTGSNLVTDYSTPGAVSFDLDLSSFSRSTLNFVLEAEDLAGPLSFDALVRNLTGLGLDRFTFSLQGIRFAQAGTVTPGWGTLGKVEAGEFAASINFTAPEYTEFQFGDVLGDGGRDWLLDTRGLQAGDSFSITASVPEPSTAALVLPMLCMASLCAAARRRKER